MRRRRHTNNKSQHSTHTIKHKNEEGKCMHAPGNNLWLQSAKVCISSERFVSDRSIKSWDKSTFVLRNLTLNSKTNLWHLFCLMTQDFFQKINFKFLLSCVTSLLSELSKLDVFLSSLYGVIYFLKSVISTLTSGDNTKIYFSPLTKTKNENNNLSCKNVVTLLKGVFYIWRTTSRPFC